jgi:hypothetical protein
MVERMTRTTNDVMRTLLIQTSLPPRFWAKGLHTTTYVLNCLPSTACPVLLRLLTTLSLVPLPTTITFVSSIVHVTLTPPPLLLTSWRPVRHVVCFLVILPSLLVESSSPDTCLTSQISLLHLLYTFF